MNRPTCSNGSLYYQWNTPRHSIVSRFVWFCTYVSAAMQFHWMHAILVFLCDLFNFVLQMPFTVLRSLFVNAQEKCQRDTHVYCTVQYSTHKHSIYNMITCGSTKINKHRFTNCIRTKRERAENERESFFFRCSEGSKVSFVFILRYKYECFTCIWHNFQIPRDLIHLSIENMSEIISKR